MSIASVTAKWLGKKRGRPRKQRDASEPPLSDDPRRMMGQLQSGFAKEFFKHAPAEERISIGRQVVISALGQNANPKAAMMMELYQSDPDYRAEQRRLLLEEQEAEVELKRAKARGYSGGKGYDDDDDLNATLKQYMQGLLIDRLQNGPERGGFLEAIAGVARELAPALRPALTQAMNGGQPGPVYQHRELPPAPHTVADHEEQASYPTHEETPMPEQPAGEPPKVLDLFGPEDIKRLFSLGDWDQAGEEAFTLVEEAIDAAGPLKALQLRITASTFPNVPFEAITEALQEFRQYPEWAPVVSFIAQHPSEFASFQAGFAKAMQTAVGA